MEWMGVAARELIKSFSRYSNIFVEIGRLSRSLFMTQTTAGCRRDQQASEGHIGREGSPLCLSTLSTSITNRSGRKLWPVST